MRKQANVLVWGEVGREVQDPKLSFLSLYLARGRRGRGREQQGHSNACQDLGATQAKGSPARDSAPARYKRSP